MKNVQIKMLFEQGCTPEQIVEAYPELSLDAVKLCLLGSSPSYRKQTKKTFNQSVKSRAVEFLGEVLDDPDAPYSVKMKAARFIIDEDQGRNDIRAAAQSLSDFNVNVFNMHLARVDERLAQAKQRQNIIELTPEDAELLAKAE